MEDTPVSEVSANGTPAEAEDSAAALEAATALAEERYAELQYALAEIDNVRKRAERSATERLSYGRRQMLGKFLPVLDNLQRALAFDDSEGLRGGLNATLRGFESLLQSEGVTPLEMVGRPFDPKFAEAIATRETSDAEDGAVIEEVQRGYMLGDDLLRPASVIVAKHTEPANE